MPIPAAIDNDFLTHFAGTNGERDQVCALIQDFFQSLNVTPQMHELVWQREVRQDDPVIRQLIANQTVQIQTIVQKLQGNPQKARYYEMLVKSVYRELYGEEYPCDVFTQWKYQQSLGEIHSIIMCMFLNYVCLLSDDKAARKLQWVMKSKAGRDIPIYSREDCRKYLQEHPDQCTLAAKDLRHLCHVRC